MATPEQQATLDAITDLTAALSTLNTIIAAADAGGAAWDNATPAQRTAAIRTLARATRGLALLLQGHAGALGTAAQP